MIIRNHTTKRPQRGLRLGLGYAACLSKNRGYERSEHPRIADEQTASTLKGSPIKQHGHSFRVLNWMIPAPRGYFAPPVNER